MDKHINEKNFSSNFSKFNQNQIDVYIDKNSSSEVSNNNKLSEMNEKVFYLNKRDKDSDCSKFSKIDKSRLNNEGLNSFKYSKVNREKRNLNLKGYQDKKSRENIIKNFNENNTLLSGFKFCHYPYVYQIDEIFGILKNFKIYGSK
jgi:hypothetical protein